MIQVKPYDYFQWKKRKEEEDLLDDMKVKSAIPPWVIANMIKARQKKKEEAEIFQQQIINEINQQFPVAGEEEDESYKYSPEGYKLNKKYWRKK